MHNEVSDRRSGGSIFRQLFCWQTLQAVFVLAYLLLILYGYYHERVYLNIATNFAFPLTAAFAGIVLTQTSVRRRWDVRVLMLFWCWVLFAELINYDASYGGYSATIYHVLLYALVCYPLAQVLPDKTRRGLVHGVLHVFVAACTALCVWAICTVVAQRTIVSPYNDVVLGDALLGLDESFHNRLFMFMHPNRAGLLCNMVLLIAVYMILSHRSIVVKVCYAVVIVISATALALTDSRTNLIAVSVCIGALGFLILRKRMWTWIAWKRWLAGIACAVVVVGVCLVAFEAPLLAVRGMASWYGSTHPAQETGGDAEPPEATGEPVAQLPEATADEVPWVVRAIAAVAQAEEGDLPDPVSQPQEGMPGGDAELPIIIVTDQGEYALDEAPQPEQQVQVPESRDVLSALGNMGGRLGVWRATMRAIENNPLILLKGTSAEQVMGHVLRYATYPFAHLHNSFLQVTVAVGLPGLALIIAFLVLLCIQCVRLFLRVDDGAPLSARFLPLLLLSCMVVSMTESLFFLSGQKLFDVVFFLIAGYVVTLAAQPISKADAVQQPDTDEPNEVTMDVQKAV